VQLADKPVLASPPAVDSVWEQYFPERYAGTRVRVTAVSYEDGRVMVESEEPAFPGGRVWLDLTRWLEIYTPVG
jgi:hypothetical protein